MTVQLAQNVIVAGRFRLNHQIGRGGMGSVWHATHLGLDIPCAVKFIEGEYAPMAEAQTRFEREAKAAATLRSPNVVQILDHGVWDGTPYIAMELLEGEDLGKRLQKLGRLTPRDTHAIVLQVCRALSKAHSNGIVHRDLKPDNIYLVRDDDREIAKVLDFGIAKHDQHTVSGSNTKTGAMLGTPYYMSPEQAQGTKSVDFRSDLWSLAIIVYQCITGQLPFESEALGDLLVKIIVNPLPVPSLVADVPVGFDAWWARAASREPSGRFASAKEFGDSLGLVCGISQLSGVTDRADLQTGGGAAHYRAPGMATPQPDGARPLASSTGGSMAQSYTYADGSMPKKALPVAVIAAIGGVVVVGGLAAALMLSHGKGADASSAGKPPAETAVAPPSGASAPLAAAPKAAEPAATLAPPAEAPAATASQAPASPPAPGGAQAAAPKWQHAAKPAAGGGPAKPATGSPKPAGAPAGGKDLGF
jgi:serine/threonine-protein kinase